MTNGDFWRGLTSEEQAIILEAAHMCMEGHVSRLELGEHLDLTDDILCDVDNKIERFLWERH